MTHEELLQLEAVIPIVICILLFVGIVAFMASIVKGFS
ncbi:hypothetical protein QGX11_gp121 [Pseudomonas phage PPSC2]|uniref:Uncharacterized protein n=1 Tax=Pseudomonas phage PPSC2 TaxID=2041350 RepID=A0A2R2YAT1_9CAUD|nr:hypothetical protein QGX11_gp121 [Pseudomonas phage PPSC2]ATN92884.1 hypothetical protein PPSC2_121 [Pseudomonas phage PPSC2]